MMRTRLFQYKDATARLVPVSHDKYRVEKLWSPTRGAGHAKGLMRGIVAWADRRGMTLVLTVRAYGDTPMDDPALEAFYVRFGFYANSRNPTRMIRHPFASNGGGRV